MKGRKTMKHFRIFSKIMPVLLSVAAVLSLSSCANRLKFQASSDSFVNNKTGIEYHYVIDSYMPKAVGNEAYSTWVMTRGVKVEFFPIQGLEPTEWLYSSVGDLITSLDVKLPGLSGFLPNKAFLCYNSDITASFAVISDEAVISSVVSAFETGTLLPYNFNAYNTYIVLFESDAYPEFYYKLSLIVTEDAAYLGSRLNGVVDVTGLFGDLLPDYVDESELN